MLGLAFALAQVAAHQAAPPASPPDILLIVVDDLGWGDLALGIEGMAERADVTTPALTSLAAESVVLRQAYAAAPNCAPSRASLQTGRTTPRHGIHTVGNPHRGKAEHRALVAPENRTVLADEEFTLAEVLGAAGYDTAHVGKWHLGEDPKAQGYGVNVAGHPGGHPKSYFAPYRNPALEDGPEGEYLTTRLTDEALGLLAAPREAPLFLHLAYYTVHTPLQAPKARVLEKRAAGSPAPRYAAMVEALDAEIARIRSALAATERGRRTVVVLTSDNGGYGRVTNRDALRGCKGTLDEGGVRVPLLVRLPGRARPRVSDAPVHHVDLLPTLAQVAGAELPDVALDGTDLTAHLAHGAELPPRALYFHFPAYLEGKSDRFAHFRTEPGGALRAGDWKLVEFFGGDAPSRYELYDLGSDPRETDDRSAVEPERTAELAARLRAWRAAVDAQMPETKQRTPE